jgi:single-strand DNA-binding protein
MNKVYLIGRSGADAELRYTPNNLSVLNFSIATSEKKEHGFETHWHRITLYGEQAEKYSQRIKRGSEVFVEGKIYPRQWTDTAGNKRTSVDIVASTVRVIDTGKSTSLDSSSDVLSSEDIPF